MTEHDKEFDSVANEGVLNQTSYYVKSHVRFYFRPRTPTYYHFEKKCGNNVVSLIFDKDLATMEDTLISIGNACHGDVEHHFDEYVTSEFNENFWRKVFDFSGAYRVSNDFYDDDNNGYWTVSNLTSPPRVIQMQIPKHEAKAKSAPADCSSLKQKQIPTGTELPSPNDNISVPISLMKAIEHHLGSRAHTYAREGPYFLLRLG